MLLRVTWPSAGAQQALHYPGAMAGSAAMESRHPGVSKLLLLAAEDMRQAATAARFLKGLRVETGETMTDDQYHLIHVLETGLVVAYMRPFSRSDSFEPLTRDE